jgi:DNA-binding NarL/FixJ family response regulator
MGYLLKDGTADYIGSSILEMIAGGSPISPQIARYLLRRFRVPAPAATGERAVAAAPAPQPQLSEREHEVLQLIVKGFSYAEIAGLLGLSAHTVTTHVRGIYRKLAVHSRGEAVYEALATGLVKLDD